jgi:iron complex outermembrane receptor protein
MSRGAGAALLAAVLLLVTPPTALAQLDNTSPPGGSPPADDQVADLGLEQLMSLEVQSVFGASKFLQKITEAPASVTVVTAEDIRRFGYRNLGDLLARVRGIYTTSDRTYSFLGVRGFGRPGDYNTRVLVLVDGFRTNDNVYDQGPIGEEFLVPMELMERVEIVRGPSSSLYGSNAFFAIVNVITKGAGQLRAPEGEIEVGNLGYWSASARVGHSFANGTQVVASGTTSDRDGYDQLYFPELDEAGTTGGVAHGLDWTRRKNLFATVSFGGLVVQGAFNQRDKGIPTGAWGSVFNDPRASLTDRYGSLNVAYQKQVAGVEVRTRGFYADMGYTSELPYEIEEGGLVLNRDVSAGRFWGAEMMVAGTWRRRHRLTAGVEVRNNFDQNQANYDVEPFVSYFEDRRSSVNWAWYAQNEIRLGKHHLVNVGVRQDYYETFDAPVMPRVAWIVMPSEQSTVKLLYGSAFRAPNAYETWYAYGPYKANPELEPERIRTVEAVFEQQFARRYRVSAGVFRYWVTDLINQGIDPADEMLVYANDGDVNATGVELEFEGRWPGGVAGRASLALQGLEDADTGATLDNAPERIGQVGVTFPLLNGRLLTGFDLQAVSARRTKSGATVDAYVSPNLTVLTPSLFGHLDLSLSLYNLLDARYYDPAAEELPQDAIQQDGRTVRLRCTWRF